MQQPDSDCVISSYTEGSLQKPTNAITELYLGNSKLKTVKSLARFTNLHKLWANSNFLRTLKLPNQDYSFIRFNYRITELHLQKNEITSITGTISHLHCLQVLMLHQNQLCDLKAAVKELLSITTLKRLNFFGNPMGLDENYRPFVIHSLPSVRVLDRKMILDHERRDAQKTYNPAFDKVRSQIGFLKKVDLKKPDCQNTVTGSCYCLPTPNLSKSSTKQVRDSSVSDSLHIHKNPTASQSKSSTKLVSDSPVSRAYRIHIPLVFLVPLIVLFVSALSTNLFLWFGLQNFLSMFC